jgi:hypothetical protein
MTRLWAVNVVAAFGRLVAIAGAALSVGAVAAHVGDWLLFAIRFAPDWNVGILPLLYPLQVVVAGWVTWGALKRGRRPLLRDVLVGGVVSFVLLFGWYFLLAGGGMGLIALGNLLYLSAALPLALAVMASSALGDEQGSGGVPGEAIGRRVRSGATALGLVLFVTLAAVAGYQAMPRVPSEDQAISPPERPSCPEYLDEEVATFGGGYDRITRAFEVRGYWGYEYASTGYGTMQMTLLDEDGEAPFGTESAFPAGNSVGGGESAHGGTFRLKIEADDARYAVVVCEGQGPNGEVRDDPG